MSLIKRPEDIGLISVVPSCRIQEFLANAELSYVFPRETQDGCRLFSRGSGGQTRRAVAMLLREFGLFYSREGFSPAERLVYYLDSKKMCIGVAESCTGGLTGGLITAVPGSSEVFWGGFLTYSNESKTQLLRVDEDIIISKGAVSSETAAMMAEGVISWGGCDVAVAVSGIAGPGGGTVDKPVGTVWFAVSLNKEGVHTVKRIFHGTRDEIRRKAASGALLLTESVLRNGNLDTNINWQYT